MILHQAIQVLLIVKGIPVDYTSRMLFYNKELNYKSNDGVV